MNKAFPPDLELFVQQALQSGEYQSEDDLVFVAVRVLREVKERHDALRRDVATGLASLDRGEGTALDMLAIQNELASRLALKRTGD